MYNQTTDKLTWFVPVNQLRPGRFMESFFHSPECKHYFAITLRLDNSTINRRHNLQTIQQHDIRQAVIFVYEN